MVSSRLVIYKTQKGYTVLKRVHGYYYRGRVEFPGTATPPSLFRGVDVLIHDNTTACHTPKDADDSLLKEPIWYINKLLTVSILD